MRDFEKRGAGRLRLLPFHARLVYSIFLGFTLLAMAITAWLTDDLVGLNLDGLDSYYGGVHERVEAVELPEAAAFNEPRQRDDTSAGPVIELPDELEGEGAAGPTIDLPAELAGTEGHPVARADDGPKLRVPALEADPMPLRKLLEVTHFHLFSMPVYLLILCHIFMLSRASHRSKTLLIVTSSLGTALHMAAPWAARSLLPLSGLLYGVSGTMLAVSFVWMSALPLYEMWAKPPAPRKA